ncbi:hypothetical protein Tco_1491788 [Tanacetum coccineum]
MDIFTKGASWDYWKIGSNEIEVSDDESSDFEKYRSDKEEETAEIFKIETDIMGFKTYEDYKDDWIYEWNENVPWMFRNGPSLYWKERMFCNGGNFPGAYRIGNSLRYQDLEWYEALEDSELKDKALMNKKLSWRLEHNKESGNDKVNSFTMKMEILLESTSNKLMVEHAEYDESNTYVLERFNTSAGNPVKKILLKLNLSDHRLCKMVVECQSVKVKEFQERCNIKAFQEWYEHVGPEVASPQGGKVTRWRRDCAWLMISRCSRSLCQIQVQGTSSIQEVNDHYNIFTRESQEYELKTKDKATFVFPAWPNLKKFKKDAPCQAFKNQERHRLKGESSPSQRLKGESSPSPLLVSTRRNQQHLGRAFT